MIAVLMTFFLKFHLMLVSQNKTTIENLEKKGTMYKSNYDVGANINWQQVFGTNRWLWPFPVFMGSGKPLGDGIYWESNLKDNLTSPTSNRRTSMSPSRHGINTPSNYRSGVSQGQGTFVMG